MESDYLRQRREKLIGVIKPEKLKEIAQEKPVKAAKQKIKPRSKKQDKKFRVLRKEYGPYLEKHPFCVIRLPGCTNIATTVNHTKGRGANTLNQKDWEPSCSHCNGEIEKKPGHDGGIHKKSQHKKSQS